MRWVDQGKDTGRKCHREDKPEPGLVSPMLKSGCSAAVPECSTPNLPAVGLAPAAGRHKSHPRDGQKPPQRGTNPSPGMESSHHGGCRTGKRVAQVNIPPKSGYQPEYTYLQDVFLQKWGWQQAPRKKQQPGHAQAGALQPSELGELWRNIWGEKMCQNPTITLNCLHPAAHQAVMEESSKAGTEAGQGDDASPFTKGWNVAGG